MQPFSTLCVLILKRGDNFDGLNGMPETNRPAVTRLGHKQKDSGQPGNLKGGEMHEE